MSKIVLVLVLAVAGFGLVACGGSEEKEEGLSGAAAQAELTTIADMLDHALEEYGEGEAAEAEEIVGDAYLEHFELVEHALEEEDHELMEELELAISTTIRNRIKEGAPQDEVAALVEDTKTKLDQAEELLA